MKKTLLAILLLIVTIFLQAQDKKPKTKSITLVVTYVHREEGHNELIARRGYQFWKASNCKSIPDSIKVGTKLYPTPARKRDNCECIFKRIK